MMVDIIPKGKVPWQLLKDIIENVGYVRNAGIIQKAEPGVDVAVLNIKEISKEINDFYGTQGLPFLVYKSDPITFPTPNPAKFLITVNQNDLVTSGAIPYGITITIMLPSNTNSRYLVNFQEELSAICNSRKITILGGHTEVTEGVAYPIFSASMIGFVPSQYYIPRKPKPNDAIICSGWVAAEGTSILLSEGVDFFQERFGDEYLKMKKVFYKGLDISERILLINKKWHDYIHLVHDATEGGILGALYECLVPKALGCNVFSSKMPISQMTKDICNLLGIDPFRLISSGAVLVFCDPEKQNEILADLENCGMPAKVIGNVTQERVIKMDDNSVYPPSSDQIIDGLKNLKKIRLRLKNH
ncbi:MAG: AIR synthase-related protein [Candidatus Hodarchaeales archaeon]